jgi:hypothetical protein
MALPDTDPARAPELLLGDILTYIEQADASVQARDMAVLAGLDTVVEALCQRITALDPAAAKEYAPELAHLMERLDQLQQNMMRLQGEVNTTITSLNSAKKANNAYKKNTPEA